MQVANHMSLLQCLPVWIGSSLKESKTIRIGITTKEVIRNNLWVVFCFQPRHRHHPQHYHELKARGALRSAPYSGARSFALARAHYLKYCSNSCSGCSTLTLSSSLTSSSFRICDRWHGSSRHVRRQMKSFWALHLTGTRFGRRGCMERECIWAVNTVLILRLLVS